jgi:hypothetical protein
MMRNIWRKNKVSEKIAIRNRKVSIIHIINQLKSGKEISAETLRTEKNQAPGDEGRA